MNGIPLNFSPIGYNRLADTYRTPPARPVTPATTDEAPLTTENKIELSQKASTYLPSAPVKKSRRTEKKSKVAQSTPSTQPKETVRATDSLGRVCTGSLHGPLLMEDLGLPDLGTFSPYTSQGFRYDNTMDFQHLRSGAQALATLSPQALQSDGKRASKIEVPGAGPAFIYRGIQDGMAVLVQHYPRGGVDKLPNNVPARGEVGLPDGQTAYINRSLKRGGAEVEMRFPPSTVGPLADWGRTLLAIG